MAAKVVYSIKYFRAGSSISACWIIYRIASYAFSYEQNLPNKENMYRALSGFVFDDKEQYNGGVSKPMYQGIREQIGGIDYAVPLYGANLNITRKTVNHEIINALDNLLGEYFLKDAGLEDGLPSVQYASAQLNLSQRHLSNMLRSLTGQNTQQYIQTKIIGQSKDLLSSTSFSVAEIAYN